WDYTVIGPEVNKAQRLESAAEAGSLLLARRTYALARNQGVLPDDLPPCTFALKGIGGETDLYAVPAELVAQLAVSLPYQEEGETADFPFRPAPRRTRSRPYRRARSPAAAPP